jgi:hypothetical protein
MNYEAFVNSLKISDTKASIVLSLADVVATPKWAKWAQFADWADGTVVGQWAEL